MRLPSQAQPVYRSAGGVARGGVDAQCSFFKCGLAVAKCVARCTTSPTCYLGCLGDLCSSCCDCIPVVGNEVCKLCP